MAKNQRDELVFVPLGGVGEIGMNMGAYGFGPERSRKWIVVDCGVTFGGPDLKTVYLGSLKGNTIPYFRSPVAGLPMVHW